MKHKTFADLETIIDMVHGFWGFVPEGDQRVLVHYQRVRKHVAPE